MRRIMFTMELVTHWKGNHNVDEGWRCHKLISLSKVWRVKVYREHVLSPSPKSSKGEW